jgi:uncharacterized protein (TIGR04255 family)
MSSLGLVYLNMSAIIHTSMTVKSSIIDSIVEIVFDSTIPSQALVGILFQEFSHELTQIDNLPILQVPVEFREQNPDLMKQPNYRMHGENFSISLGEGLMSVGTVIDRNEKQYPGWRVYGNFANRVVDFLIKHKYANNLSRISVRYVNFFDTTGLADKFHVGVNVAGNEIASPHLNIYYEQDIDGTLVKVQIAGDATVANAYIPNTQARGSIIDITANKLNSNIDQTKVNETIKKLHDCVEKLFFDVMKKDALPYGVVSEIK